MATEEYKHCIVVLGDGQFAIRRETIRTYDRLVGFFKKETVVQKDYAFLSNSGRPEWFDAERMKYYSFHKFTSQEKANDRLNYYLNGSLEDYEIGIEVDCK